MEINSCAITLGDKATTDNTQYKEQFPLSPTPTKGQDDCSSSVSQSVALVPPVILEVVFIGSHWNPGHLIPGNETRNVPYVIYSGRRLGLADRSTACSSTLEKSSCPS